MVQRVAMHVIRRAVEPGKRKTDKSPAVPPKEEIIQPGTLIETSGQELAELEAAGAVVPTTDKRAAKFGYGSRLAQQIEQENGETDDSAARRRRRAATNATADEPAPARRTRKSKAAETTDPLVG